MQDDKSDVELFELAFLTTNSMERNWQAWVGVASSSAIVCHLRAGKQGEIDFDTVSVIKICRKDFKTSLANDIKLPMATKKRK